MTTDARLVRCLDCRRQVEPDPAEDGRALRHRFPVWAILLFLFCATARPAAAQGFDPSKVGPPSGDSPAELYLPNGTAPAAAVVVLHGCNGDADDWTPVARCVRWRELVRTNGHVLQMKIYPGARHAFDAPSPPHYFAGHYIGQDPAATTDAPAATRKFFDQRLLTGSR